MLGSRCQGHPLPYPSFEPSVGTAMALVWQSVSTAMWGAYEKVWRERETLVESVQADDRDQVCVLHFVGRAYGQGMSPTGMSKQLSALAFWFKLKGGQM